MESLAIARPRRSPGQPPEREAGVHFSAFDSTKKTHDTMKLTPKQKLTIFSISESMANTNSREIEIVSVLDTPEPRLNYVNGPLTGHRFGTFKERGKRKTYFLDIRLDALVFEGWDLPLITDWDIARADGCTRFSGNACYNLGLRQNAGDPPAPSPAHEALLARSIIETLNINLPLADSTKAKCLLCRPGDGYDDGELLWPEIEVAHAVINRMKEKLAA